MARPAGLEPATPGLEGRCSIRLSYGRSAVLTEPVVGMVGVERFELPTHCSQSSCATRLRYTPNALHCTEKATGPRGDPSGVGAPGRIRTSDRLVRSQVLYPAELLARVEGRHIGRLVRLGNPYRASFSNNLAASAISSGGFSIAAISSLANHPITPPS